MIGIARVAAWWAVAAGCAWLCLGSLIDRLAGQGVLVHAPATLAFGGNVLTARAEEAWQAGDLVTAERLSRAAVARRPIDAATLRLAGSIALARGDRAHGDALMRAAGAAGWRDRETQIYWGEAAVEQGAWDIAVDRAEALARLGLSGDLRALLRRIEATRAGRAALLRRWREDGGWLTEDYAAWPADPVAMANRFAMVSAMRAGLGESDRARLAAALIPDHIDWAFAILRPDEQRLVFTGDGDWSPLGWNVSAAPGIEASVDGDGLRIVASGSALLPLADRLLRLPVGRTRLSLRVEGAHTDLPLIAVLACVQGAGATAVPVAQARFAYDLLVPAGCRPQRLSLAVAGEEARRGADLRLAAPTLSRAGVAP